MTAVEQGDHLFDQLSWRDIDAGEAHLVMDLEHQQRLTNNRGAIQGGLVATLIDVVAGRLAWSVSPDGRDVATADMNIHFLAPILVGPARATATVVRAGKQMIVISVEVIDVGRDRKAAISTCTFSVLEKR